MDKKGYALKKHEEWNGKLEVNCRCEVNTMEDLIREQPEKPIAS